MLAEDVALVLARTDPVSHDNSAPGPARSASSAHCIT